MLKGIRLIVYDFDGVFTDNRVIVSEDGIESVIANRADGLAVGLIKKMGIAQLIMTTEMNKVVKVRAKKLGIPVISGADDKKAALLTYCVERDIPLDNVVYVGNDINDLEAMKIVGHPVCPADAESEIKNLSVLTLETPGGGGVAREMLLYLTK